MSRRRGGLPGGGVGVNKYSGFVEAYLNKREKAGGKAFDMSVLADNKTTRKRPARYGRRSPSKSPGAPGERCGGGEDEIDLSGGALNRVLQGDMFAEANEDQFQRSGVDDPPPSKLMASQRSERPDPPAKPRRRYLSTVTARYMPKFQEEEDKFKERAGEYAQTTGFGAGKVRSLHREFMQYAKPAHSTDPSVVPHLDMFTFSKLMAKHNVTEKALAHRIFDLYDRNRTGTIDFKHYINALAIFKSANREVQAKALFRMCDIDGDRRLGKLELLKFINQGISKDKRVVVSAILDELMYLMSDGKGMDVGEVTYTQFIDAVTQHDQVWQLFRALSPFTRIIDAAGGEHAMQKTIT